jgi:hypothetical protein
MKSENRYISSKVRASNSVAESHHFLFFVADRFLVMPLGAAARVL